MNRGVKINFNPASLKNLDRTKHGMYRTRTYESWQSMLNRVKNPSKARWYGGLAVCERWKKFENFLADMGERSTGTSLDRIDGTKGYEPGNCRWATNGQQQVNKRTTVWLEFNGKRQCLKHWALELGIGRACLQDRIKRGWSVEKALSTKVRELNGRGKVA